jgi:hypothetical protein
MLPHLPISRRTALKGLGAAVALPWLEAMLPTSLGAAAAAPRRLAFVYVPNGVIPEDFFPTREGADFDLPRTLAPLVDLKDDVMVLGGLTCDKARANGDGPGDHARAMASFLTGCQARKTSSADIQVGVSADQVVAQHVGKQTRFASLEIGCEGGRNAGSCDSGYSCAYSNNLAWRSPATPLPKETNPRLVFERLFSKPGAEGDRTRARMRDYKKSILDFVAEDARDLKRKLGGTDVRKLDEYLSGVREIEQRLARADRESAPEGPEGYTPPTGTPREFKEHLRLMADMMALAFQADLTRVCTFVFANEGSNRPYRELDVREGHHSLTHHGNNRDKKEQVQRINQFHIEQFAYLLGKLKGMKEGAGSVLDNSMVVYGSGNADGNRHTHHNLPILLAGKGGGTLKPNRYLVYPRETPITNLYLALFERMGVKLDSFGDSNDLLLGLDG